MAADITATPVVQRFVSGHDYKNLTVIKFDGPNGAKAVAYSCNLNIDFDGEPQAYAALSHKPSIRPLDVLGDAGFLFPADNDRLRRQFDDAKNRIADLEKLKADSTKPEEKKTFQ